MKVSQQQERCIACPHTDRTLCPAGGHQADQLAEAAEERANHQRDSGYEGDEESQHRQLRRQVTLT